MRRQSELCELMDDPAVDRQALATSLRFIRGVNRYLGGTRAVLGHLKKWSGRWERPEQAARGPITFLDVATGSADIPLAVIAWGRRRGFDLRFTAIDLHATTLDLAREHVAESWRMKGLQGAAPIDLLQADALHLPFPDAAVDYVLCSMFLHHLSDADALRTVREMLRVARRGVIVNDLLRSRLAQAGITLLTLFSDPIDKHDARVSVRKAWTRAEVERWRAEADAPWMAYHEHLPARFTLAGERT